MTSPFLLLVYMNPFCANCIHQVPQFPHAYSVCHIVFQYLSYVGACLSTLSHSLFLWSLWSPELSHVQWSLWRRRQHGPLVTPVYLTKYYSNAALSLNHTPTLVIVYRESNVFESRTYYRGSIVMGKDTFILCYCLHGGIQPYHCIQREYCQGACDTHLRPYHCIQREYCQGAWDTLLRLCHCIQRK